MAVKFDILTLGTGSSVGMPQLGHILNKECVCCNRALNDPRYIKRNICILIKVPDYQHNIIIDLGKTFRDVCINFFRKNNIRKIDTVFLTHFHADATGGLDDLRDIQGTFDNIVTDDNIVKYMCKSRCQLYTDESTYEFLCRSYDYIVEASQKTHLLRKVAVCDFHVVTPDGVKILSEKIDSARMCMNSFPLVIKNCPLKVQTLPVWHGDDLICQGFAIGEGLERVVILTDVSLIPQDTLDIIDSFVPFKTLIIDGCYWNISHFSHFSIIEALLFVNRWTPERTYIIGTTCNLNMDDINNRLQNEVIQQIRSGQGSPLTTSDKGLPNRFYSNHKQSITNFPPNRDVTRIVHISLGFDGDKVN